MTVDQQVLVEEVLDALRGLPGVKGAESDDFNSRYVDIFITLKPETDYRPSGRYGHFKWQQPIRSTKAAIRRVLAVHGITDFRFLDQPEKRYESMGAGQKHDLGYSSDYIQIEICYI